MNLSERENRSVYRLYLVLFWILAMVFSWFFRKQGEFFLDDILLPVLTVLGVIWLVRHWKGMKPAAVLLSALAAWYVFTRLVNSNPFTTDNLMSVMELLAAVFVAFPLAASLGRRTRSRAPVMIGALDVFLLGVIAWIAVIASLRQELFIPPLTSNMIIGISDTYNRLDVLHMHPNLSAVMFSAAFGLSLYLFAAVKNKWWRALIVLGGVGLFFAVALTVSRTAMVVAALEAGGFAYLACFRRVKLRQAFLRALAAIAVAAVVFTVALLGLFSSIDFVNDIASLENAATLPVQTAQTTPASTPAADAAAEAKATPAASDSFVDRDHVDNNIRTLSSRTEIYAAVKPAMQKRPVTLLIGNAIDQVVPALQDALGWEAYHWHNSFIQTLMTAGVPALLLILAFSGLLVAKGVCIVLDQSMSMAEQALVLPVAGLFLHGVLEAFLFVSFGLQNMLFFLLAGFLFAVPNKHKILTM